MDATGWIAFWAALFVLTHIGTTANTIRPRLVGVLGSGPYLGLYSLVSFATFIPMTMEFFRHKHAGPLLWHLRDIAAVRWIAVVLMFASLIVSAASFITPSPAGMAPNASNEPRGVLKITRHPLFLGISMFGFAHMLMNGWLGDVIYFGTFPIVSILGALHQDQRKLEQLGEPYRTFYAATSFVPGAALIDGRQRFAARDLSIPALAVGAAVAITLLLAHPHIFGGNPLG